MTYEEIYQIASTFVRNGVTKIRLTGGEPLIRKDIDVILKKLASLNIELSITTNAILVDRFIDVLKENGIRNINASLDSLDSEKFKHITRRNDFKKAFNNIQLLVKEGFHVKLNVVLIKGFNEDEIINFINLTKDWPIVVRFIEFMPFNGNKWDKSKLVSYESIMNIAFKAFSKAHIIRLTDAPNDTSKNYKISNYTGSFAVISTVTNPFCDSCNRLRLTANGQLKNCLFSSEENDLLTQLRAGKSIEGIIQKSVLMKKKVRNGMNTNKSFGNEKRHSKNRSMIAIGG
tara:strand:- start:378 stop:1241 length:864 start_codon:yes stop_codon:yes gene_type:complete